MPRLADSPWPYATADFRDSRASRFPGARHGRIRWRRSLGVARQDNFVWRYQRPSAPLVRGDGAILTDWNGLVRAFSTDGAPQWEHDFVFEPKANWAFHWGGLLLVDDRDRAWVRTRNGLLGVSPSGEVETLVEAAKGENPGTPFPGGGFVRVYGTDDGYWTGHSPCAAGRIEVLDDGANLIAAHDVDAAPGAYPPVRILDDDRAVVLFSYDFAPPPHPREEWVVDRMGRVVDRRPLAPVGVPAALAGHLYLERNMVQASDGRTIRLPGERVWGSRQPEEFLIGAEAADGFLAVLQVAWGTGTRVRMWSPSGGELADVPCAAWDGPVVDRDGAMFLCVREGNALRLVLVRGGTVEFRCTLQDGVAFGNYAYPHGGLPSSVWSSTGWFHAPCSIGPDGTTLVVSDVGPGACVLFCVE